MRGGHSGVEIDENRGNAIIELAKIIDARDDIIGITDIKGGDADNAIPRSARGIVLFNGDILEFESWLEKKEKKLQKTHGTEDITITVKVVEDEYGSHFKKDVIQSIAALGS